jgi:hypothetical protein
VGAHIDPVAEDQNAILALQACIKGLEEGCSKPPKNGRGERNKDGTCHWTGKMVWRGNKPNEGEASLKTVGDITYHWCPNHGFWTTRKPSECLLAQQMGRPNLQNRPLSPL